MPQCLGQSTFTWSIEHDSNGMSLQYLSSLHENIKDQLHRIWNECWYFSFVNWFKAIQINNVPVPTQAVGGISSMPQVSQVFGQFSLVKSELHRIPCWQNSCLSTHCTEFQEYMQNMQNIYFLKRKYTLKLLQVILKFNSYLFCCKKYSPTIAEHWVLILCLNHKYVHRCHRDIQRSYKLQGRYISLRTLQYLLQYCLVSCPLHEYRHSWKHNHLGIH